MSEENQAVEAIFEKNRTSNYNGIIKKINSYIKKLKKEAKSEIQHKGSPVTSMAEDFEINAIGKEKMKIVKKLENLMKE